MNYTAKQLDNGLYLITDRDGVAVAALPLELATSIYGTLDILQ